MPNDVFSEYNWESPEVGECCEKHELIYLLFAFNLSDWCLTAIYIIYLYSN